MRVKERRELERMTGVGFMLPKPASPSFLYPKFWKLRHGSTSPVLIYPILGSFSS
jgi:hypothetical protein